MSNARHGGYTGIGGVLLVVPIMLVLVLVIYAGLFGARIVFSHPANEPGPTQFAHSPAPGPATRGG